MAESHADDRALTEQGRQRKQQLLDAAAHLFAERGYGATRIVDICAAAGVAKGLFYWYFPTKAALFAELVRDVRQQLRRAQAAAFTDDADPLSKIKQGAHASVVFLAEHASFFALLDGRRTANDGVADSDIRDALVEGAEVYRRDVLAMVLDGQRAGVIIDGDPELLVTGVVSAVSSFSTEYRRGRLDPELSVDALATFVANWVGDALRS